MRLPWTSRAGLLALGQLMASLNLSERIDRHFPQPKSNRGYPPSVFIQTFLLMKRYAPCWISINCLRQHKDNLAFIQQCQRSLPAGCGVGALRMDARVAAKWAVSPPRHHHSLAIACHGSQCGQNEPSVICQAQRTTSRSIRANAIGTKEVWAAADLKIMTIKMIVYTG